MAMSSFMKQMSHPGAMRKSASGQARGKVNKNMFRSYSANKVPNRPFIGGIGSKARKTTSLTNVPKIKIKSKRKHMKKLIIILVIIGILLLGLGAVAIYFYFFVTDLRSVTIEPYPSDIKYPSL